MDKRVFLLDAFALVFRAYYALIRSPRLTSTGKNTNAQFGFTNALLDLINKQKPSHMAVCFDTAAPTERHTDYADYKANRQETPEDILEAVPDIKKIIEAFNIPIIELDGFEADDVIGTLSKQAEQAGYEVYMVTPDKDYGQLVSDKIKIYKPAYGGNDAEVLGPEEVCARWNITDVSQVIDMLGMMGDAVDNIPGIPGVGEKTAAKFLQEYGSLENTLANADQIKGAMGEKVRKGKELALLSKKLATIITNVPVAFHEEDFRLKEWNREQLKEIFSSLEFRTLGKRLLGDDFVVPPSSRSVVEKQMPQGVQTDLFGNVISSDAPQNNTGASSTHAQADEDDALPAVADKNIANTTHDYQFVGNQQALADLVLQLQAAQEICFDTETTNIDANLAELVGLSFSIEAAKAWYVPCPADQQETRVLLQQLAPLFMDPNKTWIGHNIKYDILVLKWYGIELTGSLYDTMLAHYVFEPEGKRSMDTLSEKYLGYVPVSIEELIGKKGKHQLSMRDVEAEKIKEYACEDADITWQLKQDFVSRVHKASVENVLNKVELPLISVLADMEYEGVTIDKDFLQEYSVTLEKEAKVAEEAVYKEAGVRFNLASPKQLGEVLFDKLQLDPEAKKTKTGQYQTGEDILNKLAAKGHRIAEDILTFRELTKLQSTYVDALPQLINPKTGRVHTSYAQAVAVTGRLSSNNPNLQNIPVRTERGREIRKAFIPRNSKFTLVSADYSQIELRIVAAISGDSAMCAAFREGKDIHTATAARVYNVAEADVTKEMRYKAKSVNFGIIYGQGAFGLADNLGISRTEAKEIIANYKKEFPGIQAYMDSTIKFAKENGYVETLMGRKRWLRDIHSSNFTVRGFAERNAINSPIQGSAADMIKLAMYKIHTQIKQSGMKSKMILQVHDELIFDAHKSEVEQLKAIIIDGMQTAMTLPNNVPVIADCGEGANWLVAH
ncbi:MAG: DNA polymerase I [Chitinophagia bacterium]|nr:DNA polymerase I [Chitinophagia bacterium]